MIKLLIMSANGGGVGKGNQSNLPQNSSQTNRVPPISNPGKKVNIARDRLGD